MYPTSSQEAIPRHQCLIYDGSPARILPILAKHIQQKLRACVPCVYLNSPPMVAGLRSYLYAAGVDVIDTVSSRSLILSSEQSQLKNGEFDVDHMLGRLEDALNQALSDGYQGLWCSGDMTWELGRDQGLKKLMEYEWRLEKLFEKNSTLSGVCQYNASTLPMDTVCHGLLAHPALFINTSLAHFNPRFTPSDAPIEPLSPSAELKETVQNICAMQLRQGASPPSTNKSSRT